MIAAVDRVAVDGDDELEELRTRCGNLESQLDRKQDLIVALQAHNRLQAAQLEVLNEVASIAGYRKDEGFTAASLVARLKDGDR